MRTDEICFGVIIIQSFVLCTNGNLKSRWIDVTLFKIDRTKNDDKESQKTMKPNGIKASFSKIFWILEIDAFYNEALKQKQCINKYQYIFSKVKRQLKLLNLGNDLDEGSLYCYTMS